MTPACSTEPAPAVAILYIATGRYITYFQEFYETAGRYFLPDCRRHIILFTDNTDPALQRDDVTVVPAEQEPWPHATLMRYHLFLEHAGLWRGYDYVFFINANYRFYRRIGQEILPGPQDGGLVAALHRVSVKRKPDRFTYERRPESTACIPLGNGRHYFAGGFNGGTTAAFMEMARALREQIDTDAARGITAVWHDESHLNRYLLDRPVKVLPPTFVWPEEAVRWYNRWRIFAGPRDKRRLGGHAWLRGQE